VFTVEQSRFSRRHPAAATRRPLGGADGGDEGFTGARMAAVEEVAELGLGDVTGQAEPFAEGPDPSPDGLAVAQVVVLRRPGDLPDVIVGGAVSQLPDVEHTMALLEGSDPAL
jgi:hypothetical protein